MRPTDTHTNAEALNVPTPARARRGRPGFSIAETLLALSLGAIVLGACAAAFAFALRALPTDGKPRPTASGVRAIDALAADLGSAKQINLVQTRTIEASVVARPGDPAVPVRYSWSGTAGDPLIRRYNNGDSTPVVSNVHAFSITPLTLPASPARRAPRPSLGGLDITIQIGPATSDRLVRRMRLASAPPIGE